MSILAVVFIVVFALILFAVSAALKFLEARRKKQVVDMLQTASGQPVVTITNLLKEAEPDKPTGFQAVLASMQFSRHLQETIQQAGLTWNPTKLMAVMALMFIPGVFLGYQVSGVPAAMIFGAGFASLPYGFVRHKRKKRLDTLEEQFPESLDFLARSMRAGHAFSISLEMLGEEMPDPLGQEFRTLFNEQNLGAPLDQALGSFASRVPLLDV